MKFLHTLGTNEKAKELLEQRKPANEEEKIEVYAEIATGLGEPTTAEDFREAVKEAEERLRKKAEDAAAGSTQLEDDAVEGVAGGIRGRPFEWCGSNFFCIAFSEFPCTMAEVAICGNSEH